MRKKFFEISSSLLAALMLCVGFVGCDFGKTPEKEGEHRHSDANSDNVCDTCYINLVSELSFFAVNDLHGKFMDTANQPGVDELTTFLKDLYADEEREEILLASGDMWQGTVESSTNRGKLMTEWMNEVGFVSMTLGNHEYDWGAGALTPNSELANFPFLAINVTQDGEAVDYCQASTVVERRGVKIGIIGAIGDCLSSISGDFSKGLYFAKGNMLTSLVKSESRRLKEDMGCDFIVYSIHEGYGYSSSSVKSVTNREMSWYDTALSDGYVDLVFEAHTHQNYILKDDHGVYHLQGGGENKYISRADVSFNILTKEYTVTPRLVSNEEYANSRIEGDPIVGEIFNAYFEGNDPYTNVLGRLGSNKTSDAICEQLARLYFDTGVENWGNRNDVINAGGIVLGGGYLKLRSPYRLYAGNVTYADLFSILPFDNEIVLCKLSGRYLKSYFLESDNDDYHIYSTITSDEVQNNRDYYIIVDSYTSTYWYNLTEVARLGSGTYPRDLLAAFISDGGWN